MKSQTNQIGSGQVCKKKGRLCHIIRLLTFLLVMFTLTSTGALAAGSPIIDWTGDQIRPVVAYGSQRDEYLVVWEDHHWGFWEGWAIYGQRVGVNGTLVGNSFSIESGGSNHHLVPEVTYNQVDDEFLVVYEYEYSATDHDVRARRVGSDGTRLGDEITVTDAYAFESNPVVTYNSVDNEYLVVWERRMGTGEFIYNDIYARRVSASGTLLGAQLVIASGSPGQSAPAVAYGDGIYLVVWQDKHPETGDYYIRGQRLWKDGSPIGDELAISGGPYPGWSYNLLEPQLVFNQATNEFLATWEFDESGSMVYYHNINGRLVSSNGTMPSFVIGISQNDTSFSGNLSLTYSSANNEYVGVWEYEWSSTDHDVALRQIDSDGTERNILWVSTMTTYEGKPAIAADDKGSYLVVWEDGRDAATQGIDLYYSLVPGGEVTSNTVYLPIILRVAP